MLGIYAEYADSFLLVWAIVMTLFAAPIFLVPLAWARFMRFTIPSDTDLAVYFGRCLGVFALVVEGMMFGAVLTGDGLRFVFEVGLLFSAMMVFVHGYGGVKGIQPMTETVETAIWAAFVVLFIVFFPVASAS